MESLALLISWNDKIYMAIGQCEFCEYKKFHLEIIQMTTTYFYQ
jgi:hypothetical protein